MTLRAIWTASSRAPPAPWVDDSDSDSGHPTAIIASRPPLPPLDSRTRKRLQILPSPTHINMLLKLAQQHPEILSDLVSMLLSLNLVWPSRKDKARRESFVSNGYVSKVSSKRIPLIDFRSISWIALASLTSTYQLVHSITPDDEFFSGSRTTLTLNELIPFSRTIFDVTFTLYCREDQAKIQGATVPGLNISWEGVRDRISKCLQAVHARECG
jgi:ubiquitin-protein ligase E3 C